MKNLLRILPLALLFLGGCEGCGKEEAVSSNETPHVREALSIAINSGKGGIREYIVIDGNKIPLYRVVLSDSTPCVVASDHLGYNDALLALSCDFTTTKKAETDSGAPPSDSSR